jgi:hypothetical protein
MTVTFIIFGLLCFGAGYFVGSLIENNRLLK